MIPFDTDLEVGSVSRRQKALPSFFLDPFFELVLELKKRGRCPPDLVRLESVLQEEARIACLRGLGGLMYPWEMTSISLAWGCIHQADLNCNLEISGPRATILHEICVPSLGSHVPSAFSMRSDLTRTASHLRLFQRTQNVVLPLFLIVLISVPWTVLPRRTSERIAMMFALSSEERSWKMNSGFKSSGRELVVSDGVLLIMVSVISD